MTSRTRTIQLALVGLTVTALLFAGTAATDASAVRSAPADGFERQADVDASPVQADVDASPVQADVEASDGNLTATLSTATIATGAGDAVTVNASADGSDRFRVYVVGPRGQFYDTEGEVTGESVAEFDGSGGEFGDAFAVFDRRGTYTFVVVAAGPDGTFADNSDTLDHTSLPSGKTASQATILALDEHTGGGTDDRVVELTLDARMPRLTITDFTDVGEVLQESYTVSGVSNRGDGATVELQVLEDGAEVVAEADGTVDGERNRWSGTLDLADVDPGTYTLYVDDGESTASFRFTVVEQLATPTETPSPDVDTTETDSASDVVNDSVDTVLENATRALNESENVTGEDVPNPAATESGETNATNGTNSSVSPSTESQGPGFGFGVTVVAVVTVAVVAARLTRRG